MPKLFTIILFLLPLALGPGCDNPASPDGPDGGDEPIFVNTVDNPYPAGTFLWAYRVLLDYLTEDSPAAGKTGQSLSLYYAQGEIDENGCSDEWHFIVPPPDGGPAVNWMVYDTGRVQSFGYAGVSGLPISHFELNSDRLATIVAGYELDFPLSCELFQETDYSDNNTWLMDAGLRYNPDILSTISYYDEYTSEHGFLNYMLIERDMVNDCIEGSVHFEVYDYCNEEYKVGGFSFPYPDEYEYEVLDYNPIIGSFNYEYSFYVDDEWPDDEYHYHSHHIATGTMTSDIQYYCRVSTS